MEDLNKKTIEFEELCKIQLQILDNIDQFCREHDIKYSLAFGTLLGAVRHGGYIPWDDDIDLMMTRDNYNKFRKEYQSDKYPFVDIKTDSYHPVPLGKVYDSRTYFYYRGSIKRKYGVFVDIFPIDNMPSDILEREKWVKRINKLILLNSIKCDPWLVLFKSKGGLISKSYRTIIKLFACSKQIHNELENCYTQYDGLETDFMGAPMIFNNMDVWRVYPKECFQEYSFMNFEGKQYMAIREYDNFLKIRYGDYMQLPPENERVRKHGLIAYYK